jgi:hypothetical protein
MLGKGGVGAADTIEEPPVEGGRILGAELDVGLGLDGEGNADEFGLGWDEEARHDGWSDVVRGICETIAKIPIYQGTVAIDSL